MLGNPQSFVTGFRDLCCQTARELQQNGTTQKYFTLFTIAAKFEEFVESQALQEQAENEIRNMPSSEWQSLAKTVQEVHEFWLNKKPILCVSEAGYVTKELV